jgi:hypothetical protein
MTGKRLFDQLLENIEAVAELRANRSEPFVFVLSCVLSRLIEGDLGRYAEIVNRYDALPVLEPMTGNMNGLSPFVDEEWTRRLMEECELVAAAWRDRNTKLYRAFEAMARFARNRLAREDFTMLPKE